jgi:hypothetical protein
MDMSDNSGIHPYGIIKTEEVIHSTAVSQTDIDIESNNTGGMTIISGSIANSTDGSGLEIRPLQANNGQFSTRYRVLSAATTGSYFSNSSGGIPLNYYNTGNANSNSQPYGERLNFEICVVHGEDGASGQGVDCIFGRTHYQYTSGFVLHLRFAAHGVNTPAAGNIGKIKFRRWNSGNFLGHFIVHKVGASFA